LHYLVARTSPCSSSSTQGSSYRLKTTIFLQNLKVTSRKQQQKTSADFPQLFTPYHRLPTPTHLPTPIAHSQAHMQVRTQESVSRSSWPSGVPSQQSPRAVAGIGFAAIISGEYRFARRSRTDSGVLQDIHHDPCSGMHVRPNRRLRPLNSDPGPRRCVSPCLPAPDDPAEPAGSASIWRHGDDPVSRLKPGTAAFRPWLAVGTGPSVTAMERARCVKEPEGAGRTGHATGPTWGGQLRR
jgi:hypothetical protein